MRLAAFALLSAFAFAARADVVRILDDPREAAQARVDVIQQARCDVSAVYFLARNDRITLAALTMLRDARRRGVQNVRLVVDANFNRIPKAVLAHLRAEGVEVRVYHPIKLRHPSWIFRRMHEKAVIVDAERYITGGRNLAESYFELAQKNYIDRDVYVQGNSAIEAAAHFERLWHSRQVAELHVHVPHRELLRAEKLLDDMRDDLNERRFLALDTGNDWGRDRKNVSFVRFLHDPLGHDGGPRVAIRLAELIEAAKSSVIIESPYFVPSANLLALLEKKRSQGVTVRILTNSLRSTDGALPQAGYLKYRGRLLRDGIEVHEFKGPDVLHAKSAVIDDRTVLIGSYNVDPRSQNLNMEVMCVADDEEVAAELRASIERHMQNAWHIGPEPLPHSARYPGVSRAKTIRVWLARMLLVPFLEQQL